LSKRFFYFYRMIRLLIICSAIFVISCKQTQNASSNTSNVLFEKFTYKKDATPIISVHRGGKGVSGYPENCLETLQYINSKIPAIFEIDIASTKDNVLVLMHDDNLERTTTGQGKLKGYTYSELQNLSLVDDFGVETVYKIPKFEAVLNWAKKNTIILTIDIKRSVRISDVIDLVEKNKAEDIAVIITYDLKQAQEAYKLNPNLLLSVSARNQKELDWLINSNIPTENMLAFTGTRLSSPELYSKIHSYGIKTILGALGNLDNQAKSKGDHLYDKWINSGIDVIATDRPFAVAKQLKLKK